MSDELKPMDYDSPDWCGYTWGVDCLEKCVECNKTFEKDGYNKAVKMANVVIVKLVEQIRALESPTPRNNAEECIKQIERILSREQKDEDTGESERYRELAKLHAFDSIAVTINCYNATELRILAGGQEKSNE